MAIVVKIPILVPVPVAANPDEFPIATLYRHKRDFGIMAAIITAIAVSAAAAVMARIAMANQVNTANTINEIDETTSEALSTLQRVDAQLASGILLVNQRVDLLQHQVDTLTDMVQLSCVSSTPNLCITSIKYVNDSRFSSQNISDYLKGQWSVELEELQQKLQMQILTLNGTHVEPITLGDFTS